MMITPGVAQSRWRQERRGDTSRRSVLTLVTGGVGGLLSLPARAHPSSNAGPPSFADLKHAATGRRVLAIRHSRRGYRVVTADGNSTDFLEPDLRFKVDSSAMGPRSGAPVMLPAGQVGDRALVFFAAPEEISDFIKEG